MDLFAQHGVPNVSMQDIANQALLAEFLMRFADDVLTAAKATQPKDLRSGMFALFQTPQDEALKVEPVLRQVAGMAVGAGPLAEEDAAIDDQMMVYISGLLRLGQPGLLTPTA